MRKMMLALLCLAILSAYCCMATEPIATEGGAGQPAAEKPAGASASGVVPAATIVQVFKLDRESPKELRPTPGRGTLGRSMAVVGDYLYEGGCGEGGINWFKRNLKTGELVYAGSLTNTTLKNWYQMRATGNRLYVLGQGGWGAPDSSEGLVVYDVNPQTGAIEEKAALKGHEVAGECLEIDAEGHSIYTFCGNDGRLRWYRIEADGKPTLAGELTQKNGDFRFGTGLTLSPDGKNLYVVTSGHPLQWSREFCIWVFSRKPTGEVSFSKKVPLASVLPKDLPKEFGSYWISLAAISPDGRWVYVAMNSREQAPIFAIYQRDLETGDLTLKESCPTCVPCLRLASMSALKLVFLPDGSGGFTANGGPWGVLESFRLDKETGRLCDITDDVDVQIKCISCSELVLDAKNGWMYGPLWAAKLGKTEAKGDRPDIETTVAASVATRKWGPEADWTGWRGANYDLKSPIKGITRDWSRGLPKVWEVKGLSPQSSSWSSLAVQGDRLVMMGRHGQIDEIFCFDADKGGRPLWIAEYAAEGGDYGYGCGPQGTPRILRQPLRAIPLPELGRWPDSVAERCGRRRARLLRLSADLERPCDGRGRRQQAADRVQERHGREGLELWRSHGRGCLCLAGARHDRRQGPDRLPLRQACLGH